ncbi:unnamed protein product [Prorocentrum cordatum]|uniref:Phospholipase/carboxylesterase/thioesterase domain-containing protein n=1 Tax=Prorocentrum cordatum TaxID=2364126 RepID=A0ABN9W5E2_9DINO|nr:unnamed protein product [Polarella glacialis]
MNARNMISRSSAKISWIGGGAPLVAPRAPPLARSLRQGRGPRRRSKKSVRTSESLCLCSCLFLSRCSLPQLRAALVALKGPCSSWGSASDEALGFALAWVARLPPLQQRLGFRFQDPSKGGSWSATNLVGYSASPVEGAQAEVQISWRCCTAEFALVQAAAGCFEVQRKLGSQVAACRVERRRRGDPGGPLAEERYTVTAHSRCRLARDKRRKITVETGPLDLLPAVIIRPPSGPQRWTLIYLHGLDESALDNYADRPHFFVDGSVALKVVVPTAPSRELTIFDGWWQQDASDNWYLTKFRAWYDYLTNSDGQKEDTADLESLLATRRALHQLVQREAAELGGRHDRVILGGKSQGCCTSLDAALTCPQALGGFVGVVGHVLGCTPVAPGGPQQATPLHFFHEPQDDVVRWRWAQHSEQRLRAAGFRVHSRRRPDPEDCGHFVQGVEGTWVRTALREICAR